jgi:hypothetical protein
MSQRASNNEQGTFARSENENSNLNARNREDSMIVALNEINHRITKIETELHQIRYELNIRPQYLPPSTSASAKPNGDLPNPPESLISKIRKILFGEASKAENTQNSVFKDPIAKNQSPVTHVFLIHVPTGLPIRQYISYRKGVAELINIANFRGELRQIAKSINRKPLETDDRYFGFESQDVMVEVAQYVMMAVVFNGSDNPEIRDRMKEQLRLINKHYRLALITYDGNPDTMPHVEEYFDPLI